MEIKVDVNEKTLLLIKGYGKKDVETIVNEALTKWTSENMFKCPIDEGFCTSTEPCNSCSKSKRVMDLKIRK